MKKDFVKEKICLISITSIITQALPSLLTHSEGLTILVDWFVLQQVFRTLSISHVHDSSALALRLRFFPYPSHPSTIRWIIVSLFQNGQRIRGKRRNSVEFYHRHARLPWPLNFSWTCTDPVLTTRSKVTPSLSPLARQQVWRTLHMVKFFSLVRSLLLRFTRSDECLKNLKQTGFKRSKTSTTVETFDYSSTLRYLSQT